MAIRRPNLSRARAPAIDPAARAMELDGLVTVRVVQLAEIISRGASQVFEQRFGVKNTELRILVQLAGREPLAVNEVARRTMVDKAWISRSLRGLEKRGLVRRASHPTDSRAALVSLTEEGRALVDRFAPVAAARNRRLLAGLDEDDVFRVLDGLLLRAKDVLNNPDLTGPEPLPSRRERAAR